jgi:hypothetical protein
VRQEINLSGKRASAVAYGLIRTAITRSTPRRYGTGVSSGQRDEGD